MSKIIKTYQQLPPQVKQSINNVAVKAANRAVDALVSNNNKKLVSQRRNRTTRTRNGMRIYDPSWTIDTKTFAPVSYATSWTSGNRSLRVHQSEIIGRVSANSTWFPSWHEKYSVMTFPINPAHPTTFPWLSYIARLFDKYKFHSLKFMYINSVSTQQEGNVVLSLDYDTLDAAPSNVVDASQLAKYKINPLYCPCDFTVPTTKQGVAPWLYTFDLNATSAANVDLKTYNLGNVFLALDGVPQDSKDYGYLAVEYDVELLDKNPTTADSVFASKTFDTGRKAQKSLRSSVDPADTMEVTTTWEIPESDSSSNPLKLTFSSDVAVGSKVRVGINVKAPFKANAANSEVGYSAPITDAPTEVLEWSSTPNYATNTTTSYPVDIYMNLDITVPDSREVGMTVYSKSGCKFSSTSSVADRYRCNVIAYTYA